MNKQTPEHIAARLASRNANNPNWREELRLKMKGNKFREGLGPNSGSFYKGFSHTPESRKKIGDACRGEKCHLWRGGISASNEKEKIRKSLEYKLWREAVYKRDNWTCVFCGVRGVRLEADHIKPFSTHPELRLSIDNGRTLCRPCHKETDTYGVNARWITRN